MKILKIKTNAFTLIELIVVITIVAILWTIAFITLQGYSRDARDSVRVTDIKNTQTWLEVFHINAWKYPVPDNAISYTWWTNSEIKQWIIWNSVIRNIWLDRIIKDPLTEKNYIYSTFWKWLYYQIAYNKEDYNIAFVTNTTASSVVKWNYMFDPSLPSLIFSNNSVTSSWIFDPNVCFVVDWGKNTLDNCIETKAKMNLTEFDNSLVGYWDMESLTIDEKLKDLSWNNGNWTLLWMIYNTSLTGWILNKALIFKSWTRIDINWNDLYNFSDFSINYIAYINPSSLNGSYHRIVSRDNHSQSWYLRDLFSTRWFNNFHECEYWQAELGIMVNNKLSILCSKSKITSKWWYFITNVRQWWEIKIYINWKLENTKSTWIYWKYDFDNTIPLTFWRIKNPYSTANEFFTWIIDDIKIYNHALSDQEILQQARIAWF